MPTARFYKSLPNTLIQSNCFMKSYPEYCKANQTQEKISTKGDFTYLEVNLDKLKSEDWLPFLKAFRSDKKLKTIVFKSVYIRVKYTSVKTSHIGKSKPIKEPSLFKHKCMINLIGTLAKCLRESTTLLTLRLEFLPLSNNEVKLLSEGIQNNKTLQEFGVKFCSVGDAGIETLLRSITNHPGINAIDLSGSNITEAGCKCIMSMIRSQRIFRCNFSYDGGEQQTELLEGITRITLNDNPMIKEKGFEMIKDELMEDVLVKEVHMQRCGLREESGIQAIDLVLLNHNLTVLDISGNKDIPERMVRRIKRIIRRKRNEKQSTHKQMGYNSLSGKSISDRSWNTDKGFIWNLDQRTQSQATDPRQSSLATDRPEDNDSIVGEISKVMSNDSDMYLLSSPTETTPRSTHSSVSSKHGPSRTPYSQSSEKQLKIPQNPSVEKYDSPYETDEDTEYSSDTIKDVLIFDKKKRKNVMINDLRANDKSFNQYWHRLQTDEKSEGHVTDPFHLKSVLNRLGKNCIDVFTLDDGKNNICGQVINEVIENDPSYGTPVKDMTMKDFYELSPRAKSEFIVKDNIRKQFKEINCRMVQFKNPHQKSNSKNNDTPNKKKAVNSSYGNESKN